MKKSLYTIKFKPSDTVLIIHNEMIYYPKNFFRCDNKKAKRVLVEFKKESK